MSPRARYLSMSNRRNEERKKNTCYLFFLTLLLFNLNCCPSYRQSHAPHTQCRRGIVNKPITSTKFKKKPPMAVQVLKTHLDDVCDLRLLLAAGIDVSTTLLPPIVPSRTTAGFPRAYRRPERGPCACVHVCVTLSVSEAVT